MREVIKVITSNIPEVEALELSGNRIATLDGFAALSEKTPNVSVLHLNDNNVSIDLNLEASF